MFVQMPWLSPGQAPGLHQFGGVGHPGLVIDGCAGLPDLLADLMSLWVILACVYFLVRRWMVPEVKKVTRPGDFLLLIIIFATFLTGFLAYHQWGPYRPILILHVLSGEILLVAIPFSKLRHMLFFGFSRAYMGAEYGKVLDASEW